MKTLKDFEKKKLIKTPYGVKRLHDTCTRCGEELENPIQRRWGFHGRCMKVDRV